MSILDDLYAVMLAEVGTAKAVPDLWKQYLTALGYTQSTVIGQMQAFAEDNGMSITAALNYVASGAAGPGEPEPTEPDAPTIGTATAGDTEATVTFTPPAEDGGSEITGYTVTSSPGSITGTGAASPITVTGLTNDVEYTFTVTATNAVGTSDPSAASNAVTPEAVIENLLGNGGFDDTSVWTAGGNWSIGSGVASKTSGVSSSLSQPYAFVAGTSYEVTFTVSSVSGSAVFVRFEGGTTVAGTNVTTPGTYVHTLVAVTGNNIFVVRGNTATVCVVDNVSMVALP